MIGGIYCFSIQLKVKEHIHTRVCAEMGKSHSREFVGHVGDAAVDYECTCGFGISIFQFSFGSFHSIIIVVCKFGAKQFRGCSFQILKGEGMLWQFGRNMKGNPFFLSLGPCSPYVFRAVAGKKPKLNQPWFSYLFFNTCL